MKTAANKAIMECFDRGVRVVLVIVMAAGLSACGGANFVKKGVAPLKDGEKIGVLIASYKVFPRTESIHGTPFSDKINKEAAGRIGADLKANLTKKGFTVVMVPDSAKTVEVVRKYTDLPRNYMNLVADPASADLGDLSALFKENHIDHLLLYEGQSIVSPSTAQQLTNAAVSTGLSLSMGAVAGTSSGKPTTFTYTTVVETNGKFSFYNREQFTEKGDFYYPPHREEMAAHAIDGWLGSTR